MTENLRELPVTALRYCRCHRHRTGLRSAASNLHGLLLALCCAGLCGNASLVSADGRPDLAPGESNAVTGPAQAVGTGLVTTDLNSLTPEDLLNELLGEGVAVDNISYTGANIAAGTFSGGTGIIGCESGIILSSGSIANVLGPNFLDNTSSNNGRPGDDDLEGLIPGLLTNDAAVLEFDFECGGTDVVQFQYVFTSEEYNEFVDSTFNDVFGYFLNGVNVALVPGGGDLPVSINSVNCGCPHDPPAGSFCGLYVNNDCNDIPPNSSTICGAVQNNADYPCAGSRDTEMDGLTVVLTATGTVQPGMNHIKLAIADASDFVLDSAVFICAESFVCEAAFGACCDGDILYCRDDVAEGDCQGTSAVWSAGLSCSDLQPACAPPTCLPDLSGDGIVGPADLAPLLAAWGPNPGNPADFNGDGQVGGSDLPVVLGAWGHCPTNCCSAKQTPGCNNAGCQTLICDDDPHCCEVAWDALRAQTAATACLICDSCCVANGTIGCNDAACSELVCGVDPFCCETSWNALCATQAAAFCAACGGSDCCIEHAAPGCDDAACQTLVCDADPFCCDTIWDEVCALQAADMCELCM